MGQELIQTNQFHPTLDLDVPDQVGNATEELETNIDHIDEANTWSDLISIVLLVHSIDVLVLPIGFLALFISLILKKQQKEKEINIIDSNIKDEHTNTSINLKKSNFKIILYSSIYLFCVFLSISNQTEIKIIDDRLNILVLFLLTSIYAIYMLKIKPQKDRNEGNLKKIIEKAKKILYYKEINLNKNEKIKSSLAITNSSIEFSNKYALSIIFIWSFYFILSKFKIINIYSDEFQNIYLTINSIIPICIALYFAIKTYISLKRNIDYINNKNEGKNNDANEEINSDNKYLSKFLLNEKYFYFNKSLRLAFFLTSVFVFLYHLSTETMLSKILSYNTPSFFYTLGVFIIISTAFFILHEKETIKYEYEKMIIDDETEDLINNFNVNNSSATNLNLKLDAERSDDAEEGEIKQDKLDPNKNH